MRQYVGVILVKQDGFVLSQHRDNKPDILGSDTWCVVGGAREKKDEDLKIAAARELEEETSYKVDPDKLRELARDEYISEKGISIERTIFWGYYDGSQPIECHEGQEIRFISPAELNSLIFYPGHKGFLRTASEKVTHGKSKESNRWQCLRG